MWTLILYVWTVISLLSLYVLNYLSRLCYPPCLINTLIFLISVVWCFGVNEYTYIQKRNVINRDQLVVFSASLIQPVALPTEPLFLLPWGISEVSDAATRFCHFFGMHCCCNIVAVTFSKLHFRCLFYHKME